MATREEKRLRRKAIAEFAENFSCPEAADEFNCSIMTVYTSCKEFNIAPNTVKRDRRVVRKAVKTLQVVADLIRGLETREISAIYGITRQRIHQIKKDAEEAGIFDAINGS